MGEIFDVAVDIRPASNTFSQWVGVYISSENKQQLWIPPGFAHGFLVVSNFAEVYYKVTSYYCPESEQSIIYNDKKINIDWPISNSRFTLSKKDQNAKSLEAINNFL